MAKLKLSKMERTILTALQFELTFIIFKLIIQMKQIDILDDEDVEAFRKITAGFQSMHGKILQIDNEMLLASLKMALMSESGGEELMDMVENFAKA